MAFSCELMTVTVPLPRFMMKVRRVSVVMNPNTGHTPSGSRAEMVFVVVSIASASPFTVTAEGVAQSPHAGCAPPPEFPWLMA